MTNPPELLSAAEAVIADRDSAGFMMTIGSQARQSEHWIAFVAAVSLARNAPAIPAIPAGMKAWAGGDRAPDDWDGGVVAYRDSEIEHRQPVSWRHYGNPWDIIAYTPNHQPPADTVTIERISEGDIRVKWHEAISELRAEFGTLYLNSDVTVRVFRDLGLIKPDPDPYQEHLSKHGLTDTVEARAMFDTFQEVR